MGAIIMVASLLLATAAGAYLVHILERTFARSRKTTTGPAMDERARQNTALHREIGRALAEERTLRAELRDLEYRQEVGRK